MFDALETGRRIANFRRRMKLTQENLAESLQVSPQAVSKWETGKAMPEVQLLYALCDVLHCSVDSILNSKYSVFSKDTVNYEFTLLPNVPVSEYTGLKWPRSILYGSLFSALKLFLGLEERRDYHGKQVNDDRDYILQSAISNVCFGYSYYPDTIVNDCFSIYGLDFDLFHKTECTQEDYISLAYNQLHRGLPVMVLPRDYTDTIFAIGYSEQGKKLKGLGFLEGDDSKNCNINFQNLSTYEGWYSVDSDMLLVKPAMKTMSIQQACLHAVQAGLQLLSNDTQTFPNRMQGYGLVMYKNWCDILKEENDRDVGQIECLFPHACIHYENKLRTKQFFEMCMTMWDTSHDLMACAIKQYDEIVNFAKKIATIAGEGDCIEKAQVKGIRNCIINMLRRSYEQEALALSYIQKAFQKLL